jgi:hypothetical protein
VPVGESGAATDNAGTYRKARVGARQLGQRQLVRVCVARGHITLLPAEVTSRLPDLALCLGDPA